MLFILFVNDIEERIANSKVLLYADDMKLFRRIECREDCFALQRDLDAVAEWSENNKLLLNVKKCEEITYTKKIVRNIAHT